MCARPSNSTTQDAGLSCNAMQMTKHHGKIHLIPHIKEGKNKAIGQVSPKCPLSISFFFSSPTPFFLRESEQVSMETSEGFDLMTLKS